MLFSLGKRGRWQRHQSPLRPLLLVLVVGMIGILSVAALAQPYDARVKAKIEALATATGRDLGAPGAFEVFKMVVCHDPTAVVNGTKIDPEIVAAFKCPPSPTAEAVSALYARGLAVGRAWHNWYSTLTGDVRAGATYWMMRDYDPNACAAPDPSTMRQAGVDARNAVLGNREFLEGCLKAKAILGLNPPTNNMDYLRGWNMAMAEPPLPRVIG